MTVRQFGSVAVWQFGSLAVWQFGSVAVWRSSDKAVIKRRREFRNILDIFISLLNTCILIVLSVIRFDSKKEISSNTE